MYKLSPKSWDGKQASSVIRDDGACIPFDPANTDYQAFRTQILNGLADLEDADGNLMTAQEAIDFVNTLPTGELNG